MFLWATFILSLDYAFSHIVKFYVCPYTRCAHILVFYLISTKKPFSTSLALLLPVKQFFHLAQYAKKRASNWIYYYVCWLVYKSAFLICPGTIEIETVCNKSIVKTALLDIKHKQVNCRFSYIIAKWEGRILR